MVSSKLIPRYFVLAVCLLITVDACPLTSWNAMVKLPVARLMDWIGLRQGTWAMFAPNPVLSNRWVSAQMKTQTGQTLIWDSPLWARASIWDKFVQFRHVNYYSRINQTWCIPAAHDYLNYKFHNAPEPLESIQLNLNRMEIMMPEDGSLPPRDEAQWMLATEPWLSRSEVP